MIRFKPIKYSTVVLTLLYMSIAVIPISILLGSLLHLRLKMQVLYYALYYLVVLLIVNRSSRLNLNSFPMVSSLLYILYILMITIPFSVLGHYSITSILTGLKNYLIPFILYFLMVIGLKTKKEILLLLKSLILTASLASLYSLFEFANSIFALSSFFNRAIETYGTQIATYWTRWGNYAIEYHFRRPFGVFFDVHSTAFFLLTGVVIMTITSGVLDISKKKSTLFHIVLLSGLMSTFSRLYIIVMLLFFLTLFLVQFRIPSQHQTNLKRSLKYSLGFITIVLLTAGIYKFHIIKQIFISEVTISSTSTAAVVMKDIVEVISPQKEELNAHNMLSGLFGSGYFENYEEIRDRYPMFSDFKTELHAIRSHICNHGIIGLVLYTGIFAGCLFYLTIGGWRNSKSDPENRILYFCAFWLCIVYLTSFIHYGVEMFANNFVIAFILFTTGLAHRDLLCQERRVDANA